MIEAAELQSYGARRDRIRPRPPRSEVFSTFVWIDKNLLNYPLARDSRVKHSWIQGPNGRYYTVLGRRITLWFGANANRRCPNGFDVNLLFLLLGEMRRQNKGPEITLASLSAVVRAMGLLPDATNLLRLRASLALWSTISVQFPNYYVPRRPAVKGKWVDGKITSGKWLPGKNVDKTLPPPLSAVKLGKPEITISISESWYKKHKSRKRVGYQARVLLPLPMSGPAQNVVLTTLTSKEGGQPRRRRRYCRTIGINHGTRGRVLENSLGAAIDYYSRMGGALKYQLDGKFIRFGVAPPKSIPRKPSPLETKQRPKTKIERLRPKLGQSAKPVLGAPERLSALNEHTGRRETVWKLPNGKLVEELPNEWKEREPATERRVVLWSRK